MEKEILSIEEYLINVDRVEKRKLFPLYGVIALVAGAGLMFLSASKLLPEGMGTMIGYCIGLIALVYAAVKIFRGESAYFDKETNGKLDFHEFYFEVKDADELLDYYKKRNFEKIKNLKKASYSGMLLRILGSSSANLYFSQVLKYVPYEYVAVKEVAVHTSDSELRAIDALIR